MAAQMTTAERLAALMDHLGIEAAHVATQVPADVADFAARAPHRIAGLVLVVPTRLDPTPFAAVGARLLLVPGDRGLTVGVVERAAARLATAHRHVLADYEAMGWSDVVADRTAELVEVVSGFLAGQGGASMSASDGGGARGGGEHAGLTYEVDGQGPPLLLLPFFLAPSQWEPAVAALAERFTVIRVGGPHVGGIAALEDRAQSATYRGMFHGLIDRLGVGAEARILDVGCGSGALDRILARRLGPRVRVDAVDLNPFFLKEAGILAARDGLAERIAFATGSATQLPFADDLFDAVFSVTVLEECDADRAIAEMVRVTRPGGRVGVVVRAIDVAQWWNLDLPAALAAKAAVPPQSVAPGGVADRSLYRRMRRAGLVDLVAFPTMVTIDRPDGPIWRYREDAVLPMLTVEEAEIWRAASQAARAEGLLMQAHALHAAVATKPA